MPQRKARPGRPRGTRLTWERFRKMHWALTVQPMMDGIVYNFSGLSIVTQGGYFRACDQKFARLEDAMHRCEAEQEIMDGVDELTERFLGGIVGHLAT